MKKKEWWKDPKLKQQRLAKMRKGRRKSKPINTDNNYNELISYAYGRTEEFLKLFAESFGFDTGDFTSKVASLLQGSVKRKVRRT